MSPKLTGLPRLTELKVDQLEERYLALRSLRLVAAELGIDRSTARGHLKARAIPLESPASMSRDDATAALALYAEGKSSAAIGRALGFTNKTVIKELPIAGQVGRALSATASSVAGLRSGADTPLRAPSGRRRTVPATRRKVLRTSL